MLYLFLFDHVSGGAGVKKKDLNKREGKGRHCCLGNRIVSIPCRASYFAPEGLEEYTIGGKG